MAKGFTDKYIMSLKPAEKEYWIREGQGFAIRVYPSGEKGWYFIYTFEGRKRFMKLGSYDPKFETLASDGKTKIGSLAFHRQKCTDAKNKLLSGIDPLTEQEQAKDARHKALTVADLIKEYINKHAKAKKRSWKEDERILNKDALTAWGKRKLADIEKRDIVILLENIVERGAPGSANNNFKIIRKMFNYAVEKDIIKHRDNPCVGVKMPAALNQGERVLTEDEIKLLWENMEACPISSDIKRALKLILVTAQRPTEVIEMHSGEIDGHWWTIPAERAKNGREHRVYLTKTALDLIGQLKVLDIKTKEMKPKGFIFPCVSIKKDKPMRRLSISQAVARSFVVPVEVDGQQVFDKSGEPVTENKTGIDSFTPHDLRRTAATYMSQLGFTDEIIDAVLNHVKKGVIAIYNRNRYDKEKQKALEAWGRKLNSIIAGKEGAKVIPIGSKKAA